MESEIDWLLCEKALCELLPHEQVFFSLISVMLKKNGKMCLIIDMQLLNCYVNPLRFKYQTLQDLVGLLQPGDFLIMIDFWDGFHHVEVHPSHQHLLGLHWWNRCYVFKFFPFRLNALLWVFTCLVHATTMALMKKGMCCMVYMDDLIVMAPSFNPVIQQ